MVTSSVIAVALIVAQGAAVLVLLRSIRTFGAHAADVAARHEAIAKKLRHGPAGRPPMYNA